MKERGVVPTSWVLFQVGAFTSWEEHGAGTDTKASKII